MLVPAFDKPTVPLPFSIIPENEELDVPFTVKVTEPAALLVTVPVPANDAMVSLKPPRSKVALFTNALELEILSEAEPSLSVPADMVVVPVYAFAPASVNVPEPILVNAPEVPVLAPEIVRFVPAVVISMEEVVPFGNV